MRIGLPSWLWLGKEVEVEPYHFDPPPKTNPSATLEPKRRNMAKKRHTPEEIIRRLREAEVALAQGQIVVQVSSQPSKFVLAVPLSRPPTST